MKIKSIIKLSLLSLLAFSTVAQAEWEYIGSFKVHDGELWTANPPVYTGQEAAALIFGGDTEDYAISTNPNTTDPSTITNTAWTSGWGDGCRESAENYKYDQDPAGYNNPGGFQTARSAYVWDWCYNDQTNYVWVDAAAPTLRCNAFEQPLISDDPATEEAECLSVSKKSKRAIPVKTALIDEEGNVVLDLTLPLSEGEIQHFPVINITYMNSETGDNISVEDTDLATSNKADVGNIFRFDTTDSKWIFNLSTKDLSSGLYTIQVLSGDESAYKLDPETCTINFEKK